MSATIDFYEDQTMPTTMPVGPTVVGSTAKHPAGKLPHTEPGADDPTVSMTGTVKVLRTLTVKWDCCKDPGSDTEIVERSYTYNGVTIDH